MIWLNNKNSSWKSRKMNVYNSKLMSLMNGIKGLRKFLIRKNLQILEIIRWFSSEYHIKYLYNYFLILSFNQIFMKKYKIYYENIFNKTIINSFFLLLFIIQNYYFV